MSGEEWCELHFEDCRIPAENVLLGPGGFKKQIAGFNVERIGNAARALAFGRYAFNKARDHVATRVQFGRPLCEFQGLQWKFADMALKLEGAQLLLYRAAANADSGLPSAYETSLAKAACNLAGFEVAHEAVQAMGAHRLQPRHAGRILHAPLPRLDDRRRLGGDPEEPHRRGDLRPPLRSARHGRPMPPNNAAEPLSPSPCADGKAGARCATCCSRRARSRSSASRTTPARPPGGRSSSCARRAMPAASIPSMRGATRCSASAPGPRSRRCRRCPSTPISWRRPTAAMEAIEACGRARRRGRDRAVRRFCRGRRRRPRAREPADRDRATHRHAHRRPVEPRHRQSAQRRAAHRQRRVRRARSAGRKNLRRPPTAAA